MLGWTLILTSLWFFIIKPSNIILVIWCVWSKRQILGHSKEKPLSSIILGHLFTWYIHEWSLYLIEMMGTDIISLKYLVHWFNEYSILLLELSLPEVMNELVKLTFRNIWLPLGLFMGMSSEGWRLTTS